MLKNKIFIFLSIFILLFSFLSSSVFAFTFTGVDNLEHTCPDLPTDYDLNNGYFIKLNSSESYRFLFIYKDKNAYAFLSDDKTKVHLNGSFYVYRLYNNTWNYEGINTYNNTVGDGSNNVGSLNEFNYFYAGLYNSSNMSDGFFLVPLIPSYQIPVAMVLGQVPEEVKMIATILVPVGLIIFGTLLVVYLIRSKNLLQL